MAKGSGVMDEDPRGGPGDRDGSLLPVKEER